MTCKCVTCPECNGTGNVWYSFSGEYKGPNRCDDLDEMDCCQECGGDGLSELCDECRDALEEYERKEFEEQELALKREYYDKRSHT